MEEGNIKEHKNYLTLEEEKRKKARLVRETVEGPLLRWISKVENVKVLVQPPAPPPQVVHTIQPMTSMPSTPQYAYAYYSQPPQIPSSASASAGYIASSTPYYRYPQGSPHAGMPYIPIPPLVIPPEPIEEEQTVSKNYVVHETEQKEGAARPLWKETMAAMFGNHVNWEELKVYTGKGRPMSE